MSDMFGGKSTSQNSDPFGSAMNQSSTNQNFGGWDDDPILTGGGSNNNDPFAAAGGSNNDPFGSSSNKPAGTGSLNLNNLSLGSKPPQNDIFGSSNQSNNNDPFASLGGMGGGSQ